MYIMLPFESPKLEFHRKENTNTFVIANSGNCHQGPDTGEAGETEQRHSRWPHEAAGGGGLMLSDPSQDAKLSGVATALSGGDNTTPRSC